MMCSHSKLNKTIKGDAFNIDVDVPVEEEDAIASTVKYTLGRLLLVGTLIGKQNPLGGPCEGEG